MTLSLYYIHSLDILNCLGGVMLFLPAYLCLWDDSHWFHFTCDFPAPVLFENMN